MSSHDESWRCRDLTCQSSPANWLRASRNCKFVDEISWDRVRSLIRFDTLMILALSAHNRYEDDRYGAPEMATLNWTVPSSWDLRALGAECRVLAPPPQGDVFSCTKPQWLAQSISVLTIDHPSSFYHSNNELRTWSRRATLNCGHVFFFFFFFSNECSDAISCGIFIGRAWPSVGLVVCHCRFLLKVIGEISDRLN